MTWRMCVVGYRCRGYREVRVCYEPRNVRGRETLVLTLTVIGNGVAHYEHRDAKKMVALMFNIDVYAETRFIDKAAAMLQALLPKLITRCRDVETENIDFDLL